MKLRLIAIGTLALPSSLYAKAPPACGTLQPQQVEARTQAYLDAYIRGDRAKVLAALSPDVRMYGSDLSEILQGPDGVGRMLDLDQRLWQGQAHVGVMREVSTVTGCGFASIVFHSDFLLPQRDPVTVRFSILWRQQGNDWHVVQIANAVPTVGRGATQLLGVN